MSFGHGHGNDLLQCIEIGLGQPLVYRETDTEFIYGASREIAGILGSGDGSYGAAAVKAMTTIGVVSREMLGSDGTYSGQRAKAWGKTGPPSSVQSDAASFKLGTAAMVSSWDDLVAAITNGYPVTICCDQGFQTDARPGWVLRRVWDLGPLHGDRGRSIRPARRVHPPELGAGRAPGADRASVSRIGRSGPSRT